MQERFIRFLAPKEIAIRVAGLLGIILLWWIISIPLSDIRLPSPLVVAQVFAELPFPSRRLAAAGISKSGGITIQLVYTAGMVFISVILGTLAGYLIGLTMARYRSIRDFLEPPIEVVRAVPPLALLPFLGMWIGPGQVAQILLVASYVALMILITTITAIDNLNPIYSNFAATLGANREQIFRSIVIPATLPEMVGGIRVAMGMAWGFQVVAELVGSKYGAGLSLLMMVPRFMTAEVIATILWITILAFITDMIFVFVVRRVADWQPQ